MSTTTIDRNPQPMPPPPPASTYLSPLDRALERWGQRCAPLVPAGLSPNALTLIGFTGDLAAAAALYAAPAAPAWYGLAAAGIALHIAADSLDGPVARLRGQSSRLGAYLDQMTDSIAFVALPLALGLSGQARMGIVAIVVSLVLLHAIQQYNWILHAGRKVAPRFGSVDYELSFIAVTGLVLLWPGSIATVAGHGLNWYELALVAGAAWSFVDLCLSAVRLARTLGG